MATVIRLARFGKRHNPIYRAVVIDSRKARDDSFIEQVGFYNPNLKKPEIRFEQEKILKWLQTGAQPSDTVRSLLKKVGIMELFHELRAGRSIEGKVATPKADKAKKAKLGPKPLKPRPKPNRTLLQSPVPSAQDFFRLRTFPHHTPHIPHPASARLLKPHHRLSAHGKPWRKGLYQGPPADP